MAGPNCPEKFEGLAFGPTLPDGRRLLIVTVDNDFKPNAPSLILAFAVDPDDLPEFGWDRRASEPLAAESSCNIFATRAALFAHPHQSSREPQQGFTVAVDTA